MKNIFRRTSKFLICSHCRKQIDPGQRFHALTKNNGDMRLFCERPDCQVEMQKQKGQQSGGIKRPVIM